MRPGYAAAVEAAGNYHSGDDYIVEFLGYRFSFSSQDFEERVTAAAVRLGLVSDPELDEDETADLVELVERDAIETPRSALGEYLVRHWDELALVRGESLVYWLKKLVFRGAWLDHRVKEGLLEVDWDDERQDFTFADERRPRPARAPPHPELARAPIQAVTVPPRYAVVLPAYLAGLLALDTQVSLDGQLALGALTFAVLLAALLPLAPLLRAQAVGVVLFATIGEVTGSL